MQGDYSVGDLMVRDVVTASAIDSITTCAKIMKEKKIGCLIILKDNFPAGILTEQDIARKVVAAGLDPQNTSAQEVMSKQITSIQSKQGINEATSLMGTNEIKHLPVLEENQLVGIITAKDIVAVEPILMEMLTINSSSRRNQQP